MTSKEKKVFLGRYREMSAEEQDIREEIAFWESKAQRITSVWSLVPSGGRSDRVQDGAIRLTQLREQLEKKIETLAQVRMEIEEAIGTVESDTQRRLLRLRYIKGLTWERIALEMNYSYVHICRIHGRALEKIVL